MIHQAFQDRNSFGSFDLLFCLFCRFKFGYNHLFIPINLPEAPMFEIESIDHLLNSNYPSDGPGASVIVVKDGQVLHRKGYGLANLELNVPIQPETVFKVGSVTKQFTAVSILMLAEEGKLALSDLIEKFLPGYPTHGHLITIEHLLTHTSGIKSYTSLPEWPPTFGKDYTVAEMIDLFKYKPMDFAPGTRYAYNNSAFFLLGAIIAQLSGGTYEDFLQKRIFDPLGMKNTYGYTAQRLIPGRASGYNKGESGYQNCPYLSMTQPGGAGVLSSTVDDLALWDAALYTDRLVKPESLNLAWTPYTLKDGSSTHYGYGWAIEEYTGRQWIGHGGGIHGFVCLAARLPQEKLFAAVLSNATGTAKMPEELAFRIILHTLGIEIEEPQPVILPTSTLEHLCGIYVPISPEEHHIVLKEGKLFHRIPEYQFEEEVLPASETECFPKDNVLYRLRFFAEAAGEVTACQFINPYGRVVDTARKTDKPLPE
jgi:D-alanyl-D-alanine carboxypeptidase